MSMGTASASASSLAFSLTSRGGLIISCNLVQRARRDWRPCATCGRLRPVRPRRPNRTACRSGPFRARPVRVRRAASAVRSTAGVDGAAFAASRRLAAPRSVSAATTVVRARAEFELRGAGDGAAPIPIPARGCRRSGLGQAEHRGDVLDRRQRPLVELLGLGPQSPGKSLFVSAMASPNAKRAGGWPARRSVFKRSGIATRQKFRRIHCCRESSEGVLAANAIVEREVLVPEQRHAVNTILGFF